MDNRVYINWRSYSIWNRVGFPYKECFGPFVCTLRVKWVRPVCINHFPNGLVSLGLCVWEHNYPWDRLLWVRSVIYCCRLLDAFPIYSWPPVPWASQLLSNGHNAHSHRVSRARRAWSLRRTIKSNRTIYRIYSIAVRIQWATEHTHLDGNFITIYYR